MPIPERAWARLAALFPDEDPDALVHRLPARVASMDDASYELLLGAVVTLSEGDPDRLDYFAARAREFPDDLLALVADRELRRSVRPRKRLRSLPLDLQGGPVTLPDVPPNPLADDRDLWDGLGVAVGVLCIVCRREYAQFEPEVWLSRRDGIGVASMRIHVHPRCLDAGAARARAQGYGWHVGPLGQ